MKQTNLSSIFPHTKHHTSNNGLSFDDDDQEHGTATKNLKGHSNQKPLKPLSTMKFGASASKNAPINIDASKKRVDNHDSGSGINIEYLPT